MARIVGIDLGTTNSVVAILDRGSPEIIPNAEGNRLTPSVVSYKGDEILVGDIAKRRAITHPDLTVHSIKRHMGDPDWRKVIGGKTLIPQEISAQILMKLKRDAEAYLNEEVTRAVITVPAYFNQSQRQATLEAGQIAGLKVERIIPEPTAAALAYGIDEEGEQEVMVCDLGGGTYDVSILEIGDGVFEVRSTSGDTQLGGDDWDQSIIEWVAEDFRRKHNVDLTKDTTTLQRLKEAAEKAKIELSNLTETHINIPFIAASSEGPLNLETTLTRSTFEKISRHLVDRCAEPLHKAMEDSGLRPDEIEHIVLAGGSTRMPAIRQLIVKETGQEIKQGINPDEAVAAGAALQAGIINQDIKDVVLLDVTPLSLGTDTVGGITSRIIERNTPYPTSNTETFVTSVDDQDRMLFEVLQGEREMVADNFRLASFVMTGLPPGPKGTVQVDCTIDIDTNGIIHVTAKERRTGKVMQETVAPSELPKMEVERMIAEAAQHRESDLRRREMAEARNYAQSLLDQSERMFSQGQVPSYLRDAARTAAAHLSDLVENPRSTARSIRTGIKDLELALYGRTDSGASSDESESLF